jgi:hypothetical protein
MAILIFIVAVVVVYWLYKICHPPTNIPPLDKTCVHCGQATCEISKPYLGGGQGLIYYDVKCAACGHYNVPEYTSGGLEHVIRLNNELIVSCRAAKAKQEAEERQEKADLRALLREAAQQGVDPENFDQWLRSKGL